MKSVEQKCRLSKETDETRRYAAMQEQGTTGREPEYGPTNGRHFSRSPRLMLYFSLSIDRPSLLLLKPVGIFPLTSKGAAALSFGCVQFQLKSL